MKSALIKAGVLAAIVAGIGFSWSAVKSPGSQPAVYPITTGTKFTAAGCSNSTTAGSTTAGRFTSGTSGTCVVQINLPTAPVGWTCVGSDLNTGTIMPQTISTISSCTIGGTTTSGDIITFVAVGY